MSLTLEQKIAQKEQEIARLKDQARRKETAQKVVIGGLMLSVAKNDARVAQQLLELIREHITRKADLERLEPVIEQFEELVKPNEQEKQPLENPFEDDIPEDDYHSTF